MIRATHLLPVGLALVVGLLPPRAGTAQSLDSLVTGGLGRVASGLVAGVHHEWEPVFLRAWGHPSHAAGDTLGTEILFPFPGLTEVLIAVTARALDASGALDVHAPIGRHLPELAEPLGRISLDQLLRHTGGLAEAPAFAGDSAFAAVGTLGPAAVLAPPGEIFSRSRYSYPLAARVLEGATGLPLEDVIATALLGPLGMERSTFDAGQSARRGMAVGYLATPDSASPWAPAEPAERVDGLPVLYTNVPEVLHFLGAWMGGVLAGGGPEALPPDPRRPKLEETLVDGFVRSRYQLLTELEHTARELGHSVVLRVYPETGTAVVVWANATGPLGGIEGVDPFGVADLPWRVAAFMTERLLGPDVPVRVTEELPDSTRPSSGAEAVPLWAWAGRYANADRVVVLRPPETQGLEADLVFFDGQRELPLERLPDGTVLARLPEGGQPAALLRLVRDEAGNRYVFLGATAFRLLAER